MQTEPSPAPFVGQQVKGGFYRRYGKRFMDIVLSLCAIVLLSPLMLVIALLVKIKLSSPVIFRQERPGLNEKLFTLYKFRTMTNERDENGRLLPDAQRLTQFGRWLRSTSLDELPELVNVLRGDISLVGPRPQLPRDMVFMTPEQRRRHEVVPGLTGWAQVNGRNSVTWDEKLSLDLDYVANISFAIDLTVILMTVVKVLKRDGVGSDGGDLAEDLGDYLLRLGRISEEEYRAGLERSQDLVNGRSEATTKQ